MPFPSVRSQDADIQNTNSTAWTIRWPATIVAGDLLLLTVGCDGAATFSTTVGLTQSYNQKAPGDAATGGVLTKVADGTETGTFTLTLSASEQGAWRIASIQDWFGTVSGGVEFGGTTASTSTGPDPNSFTPSWGLGGPTDTRWRAQCAFDDGRTGVTVYPANYTINQNSDASGGAQGGGIGGASRDINAASQDPGAFTIDRNVAWVAWVTAIRPAIVGWDMLMSDRRNRLVRTG